MSAERSTPSVPQIVPKDECSHVYAMEVTWLNGQAIYWCPRCMSHVLERHIKKVPRDL